MPASPKPPRTPPKPKRHIVRRTPLKAGAAPQRRTRVRPMSDRKRAEIRQRTDVTRPGVLKRDGYRCRACGRPARQAVLMLEVHEEPPRSLGGDPNNPRDCITLCREVVGFGCHPATKSHGARRLTIEKGPDGCDDVVTFRQGERTWKG
jgi:hypothetical protein